MDRRNFVKNLPLIGTATVIDYKSLGIFSEKTIPKTTDSHRQYWVDTLVKIAHPVLSALSENKLKQLMPVEKNKDSQLKLEQSTHLEAFARLLAGMASWLELSTVSDSERKLQSTYRKLAQQSMVNAVNPSAPDFMNFTQGGQPLVDTAFLAHAILRAPKTLYHNLDTATQQNIVNALKSTRQIKPYENNWLLFSAMVEILLLHLGLDWNRQTVQYALDKHAEWYKGDGAYGDGAEFHWDYYNSFVIQPMLIDIHKVLLSKGEATQEMYNTIVQRAQRYAVVQERMISPEGTFPPVGRSLCYRFGAFQHLAQVALMNQLPPELSPAIVRCALTAVIKRQIEMPNTFDANGWLTLGFAGHQPELAEVYVSTGSVYLCATGLLCLGLSADSDFWKLPNEKWTSQKAWNGDSLNIDKALRNKAH